MIKPQLAVAALFAGLMPVGAWQTPALALGNGAIGNLTFTTTLVSVDHPAGAIDGTLRLTIGAGGTILGYYRGVDSGTFRQVSGGLDGDRIYLNISGLPPMTGIYENGTIVGYTLLHNDTNRFTALPAEQPQV
jgi:hypothetical protein